MVIIEHRYAPREPLQEPRHTRCQYYRRLQTLAAVVLISIGFFITEPAYALVVSAQVDTDTVRAGETLRLTLKIDESNKGSEPDFSVLEKDFKILGTQYGSSTRIINRSISTESSWIVTLLPRTKGKLVIPAINFDGVLSRPITLTVTDAAKPGKQGQDPQQLVFLDAEVDATEVYVQQQINFTLRLYKRTELHDPSLVMPDVEGAVQEKLGSPRSYNVVVDGREYEVVENRFAYFPQKSGTFLIPPAELNATIAVGGNGFLDPFLGMMGKQIRRISKGVEIKVLPKPDNYPANAAWLPTTKLTIEEKINPDKTEFKIGEPITRIITFQADGVAPSLLPPLPVPEGEGYKVYPEPADTKSLPAAQGVSSRRVETQAYIPTQTGTLTLPALEIPYWNVKDNKLDKATLPGRTFSIVGTVTPAMIDPSSTRSPADQPPETIAANINNSTENNANPTWQWLTLSFLGLWIATLALWLWQWRQQKKKPLKSLVSGKSPEPEKIAARRDALMQACKQNNPVAAKKALLAWFKLLENDLDIHSLGHIAQHAMSALLVSATRDLEQILYRSAQGAEWQSDSLRKAIADEESQRRIKAQKHQSALAPLHP